ncbi:MAG TPA: SufE family protein [Cryomorphaceae bacterium]|nr:SufE family protein [Cryomorphaceae bacterium]
MSDSIQKIEEEIIEEFEFFPDWMEKYEHIIDLGKTLPLIEPEQKKDENLIKGCQSQVWLNAELNDDTISYKADSDAIITKGIIALMIRVLNGQKPEDIVKADLGFIDKIGLKEHLSPTRSNGLVSMIKQMKLYAVAFQAKTK